MVYSLVSVHSGTGRLTRESFIRYAALFTLLEGVLVGLAARASYRWLPTWGLLLGTFAAELIFILVFKLSHNPVVSGFGVTGLSLGLGLLLGPVLAYYTSSDILNALFLTCLIMGGMSVIGILFPTLFIGWGGFLIGALWLLIAASLAQLILVALGVATAGSPVINTWLAWAGIAIFTFLIPYDWNVALNRPLTLDEAIDASGGLILDAVNLFIRILSVLGGQRGR
ncbi:MAG TPA: Bax inhibitor-1 family protein [Candidatus Solibacter sp.]|jgi:FtsH-binding integral membrane protein|nr:Bax inhibitor-1 family protein [Candidatus Solibacter sp.]